jgi:hypothetical protein
VQILFASGFSPHLGLRYASDMTDAEWAMVEPFMPAVKRLGRPRLLPSRARFRFTSQRHSSSIPIRRGNQMRCSTSLQGYSSAPRPRFTLMPCRARRVRRQRQCHLYFARRVLFLLLRRQRLSDMPENTRYRCSPALLDTARVSQHTENTQFIFEPVSQANASRVSSPSGCSFAEAGRQTGPRWLA